MGDKSMACSVVYFKLRKHRTEVHGTATLSAGFQPRRALMRWALESNGGKSL